MSQDPRCEARSYLPSAPCAEGGARFVVVYRGEARIERERHAACFTHGLEEVEHSHRAASIASAELEGP